MADATVERATQGDHEGLLQALLDDAEPAKALHDASEIMRKLYWEKRDLAACVALGQAAIERGTSLIDRIDDPAERSAIQTEVWSIAYNLGSFTWPGWAEPGIEITEAQMAAGHQAAELNLALTVDLKQGALAESRAHWLVGAHHTAAGELPAARANFEEAERLAEAAGSDADRLLAAGYACLVDVLLDPETQPALDEVKERLNAVPDGDGYVSQIDTALAVFAAR